MPPNRFLPLLAVATLLTLGAAAAEDPPQGAAFLKSDILGVFAHPDDETGMAATLAHYAHGQNKVIAHAYVTRGEGGGNMVGTQAGPALGVLREAELRDCLRTLGVRYAYFLDQQDFFYTESLDATLKKWRKDEALEKLVRLVRSLRPEIIVTMNPAPNPGQHGHHQAAGVLATEAFTAAADPDRFPLQLSEEGLGVWQPRKLFYGGATGAHVTTITTTHPLPDGRIPADIAGEALSQHRSQAFGGFVRSPWLRRPQGFTLVKSTVSPEPNDSDLFSGLNPSAINPVHLVDFAPIPLPSPLAFVPRPAIVRYRAWSAQQRISHLAAAFPADLPVVAGEANVIHLEHTADFPLGQAELLRFEVPEGWKAERVSFPRRSRNNEAGRVDVRITPPADALADAGITARTSWKSADISASATLHPVPLARIPRTRQSPALNGGNEGWATAATLAIGTNRIWQGKTDGPNDCSGSVRILHNGKELFVDITVTDDAVVSNIAPDDIKGHWRSDSVEICIDPAGGAEDTTGCFKIGIFPFDTTGKVRAARDADARQGPVEQTAPGLRLHSVRTRDGYHVQAAIPFSLIAPASHFPKRLGFNVLIYDGDKADAAPGENINECRLAWAPRSGVQGRPEDWGRVDLE